MESFLLESFKVISILFLTSLKFVFGPTLCYVAKFSYLASVMMTIIGSMLGVMMTLLFSKHLNHLKSLLPFKSKKHFSKRKRLFVKIWKNYGVIGVAFLTPIILTPIGGTLILISYNTKIRQIIKLMLISCSFWSFIITWATFFFGDVFIKYFL